MSDLIDRQAALDAITDELMPSTPLSAVIRAKNRLKDLPTVQPDHTADIGKKVCVDTISRQAAIDAICNACGKIDCDKMDKCEKLQLPPANCSEFPNNSDTISRQAAIDALKRKTFRLTFAEEQNCEGHVAWSAYAVYSDVMEGELLELPSAQPERRWIPCSERLPEEDKEVLISYRYKEGEGDTSHTYIDITTYGQMYFGGNKVGNYKHWRAPFEYFESNYEVVAWMLLPEPYKEADDE